MYNEVIKELDSLLPEYGGWVWSRISQAYTAYDGLKGITVYLFILNRVITRIIVRQQAHSEVSLRGRWQLAKVPTVVRLTTTGLTKAYKELCDA